MASNPWSDLIRWSRKQLRYAFFLGTPQQGMKASAALFVAVFVANFIPGGVVTIVLDVFFAILFFIHFLRYLWWRWSR